MRARRGSLIFASERCAPQPRWSGSVHELPLTLLARPRSGSGSFGHDVALRLRLVGSGRAATPEDDAKTRLGEPALHLTH